MKPIRRLAPAPEMSSTPKLIERLQRHAESHPTRDAVISPTLRLSYLQLVEQVQQQSLRLRSAGVSRTSTVGIRCSDDVSHFIDCLAAIQLCATSFTIPTGDATEIQEALVRRCRATHIVDAERIENLSPERIPESYQPDAAQLLFSTSGTTGDPKMVVHLDSDLVAQAHRHIGSTRERFACLASTEHNFAKRHRLYCAAVGATNVFLDTKFGELVNQCLSLSVNVLHVTAFQAQELLTTPDVDSLREIRLKLGGSHVPLQLREQLRQNITDNLQAGYGTTETGAIAFTDPGDADAGESVGRPLDGVEVVAVSGNKEPLKANETGELTVRCKGMFQGYFENTELTAERMSDGWFFTGDVGYLDDSGRIQLSGRSDDMFTFNSMNIYPQEIEAQICNFPGVAEALVTPKKSAVHGNIPVAFVVFDSDERPDIEALKSYVRRHAGTRTPRQFTVVDRLPRVSTGKLSRRDARSLPAKIERIRHSMFDALSDKSIRHVKPATIAAFKNGDLDIPLAGTGLDSIARMEMLVAMEVEFGVVITPEEYARFTTFGDISARVLDKSRIPATASKSIPQSVANPPVARLSQTVKFFRRVCRSCQTVAHLNKALGTMEHRCTPGEIVELSEQHDAGQLLPPDSNEHFVSAVTTWLRRLGRSQLASGKQAPEPFFRRRIGPSVTHFVGTGSPCEKKLLICFAPKAGRQLTIPNSVLMQHTDASRYDLLVIADSARESYRTGIPLVGNSIDEIINWLANLDLIAQYSAIRTVGCSAGAYLAVLAGYRLGSELAVSIAGRFHSERYPARILGRYLSTWRTVRKNAPTSVLMAYPADKGKSRDRLYARVIGRLTAGNLLGVELVDGVAGHHFLQSLAERGDLDLFLRKSVFAGTGDEVVSADRVHTILSFPGGLTRPTS